MKNVLLFTVGIAGGLVIGDILTEGAVHTKIVEAFGEAKDKIVGAKDKAVETVTEN